MTAKLAGKLDYTAATRAAIAKWMDTLDRKPKKRNYRRKENKAVTTPNTDAATTKPT